MLITDLLHSCAHDRVAAAAVSSIGGMFALRVQAQADAEGMTIGAFVAEAVRCFASTAGERDWRELVAAMRGHDHPVLAGLQQILKRQDRPVTERVRTPLVPGMAVATCVAAAAA